MKGEIELYNISFLILKVELRFNGCLHKQAKENLSFTPYLTTIVDPDNYR